MSSIATWMIVHQLATFQAENGAPEDLLGIGIDDGLHEATHFDELQRTGHCSHGQFRHTGVASLGSGLAFAQAHPPQLRIDEDGIRHQAILSAGTALLEQVRAQNTDVIVANVGERGRWRPSFSWAYSRR